MASRSSIDPHQPGRLQRAHQTGQARTGRVVRRRERRPVGQPRQGADHVRLAARAPVGDRHDAAHLPPSLPRGGGEVGGAEAHLSGTGAMPALGWSASLTDCHTWPYQGAFASACGAATTADVGGFGHLGRRVDDAVGPVAHLDELQSLARLLLDVGRVGPPRLLPLEVGDALLLLDDLLLKGRDLAALPQQRARGRGQRDGQDDEDGHEDRAAHPRRSWPAPRPVRRSGRARRSPAATTATGRRWAGRVRCSRPGRARPARRTRRPCGTLRGSPTSPGSDGRPRGLGVEDRRRGVGAAPPVRVPLILAAPPPSPSRGLSAALRTPRRPPRRRRPSSPRTAGTRRHPRTPRRRRAPPRCAAAGCTWRPARTGPAPRS